VAPDISNMVPARLTGKPFWEIYYFGDPPLWKAYIEAVRYFGIDGWFTYGNMQYQWPGERYEVVEDMHKSAERWVVGYRGGIDGAAITAKRRCTLRTHLRPPRRRSRTLRPTGSARKVVRSPVGYNPLSCAYSGRNWVSLAYSVLAWVSGFQSWFGLFDGGVVDLSYWYYDKHDWIERCVSSTSARRWPNGDDPGRAPGLCADRRIWHDHPSVAQDSPMSWRCPPSRS